MNSRSLRYALKDGFVGLFRHPLVLLASITTMLLLLFVSSSFMSFAVNLRHLIRVAGQQPPIEIMFKPQTQETIVRQVEQQLEQDSNVIFKQVLTPQENFENFKAQMGKDKLFDDFDYRGRIPYTIQVRLSDPAKGAEFRQTIAGNPAVQDVYMEQELMSLMNRLMRTVSTATAIVFIVLGVITVFIIANMTRIAVLARAPEINIMKYVGATNTYIRIPFVVQGMIVGLVGSILSTLIFIFAYRAVYSHFRADVISKTSFALLTPGSILPIIILISLMVGLTIGGMSSAFAVRKHVQV